MVLDKRGREGHRERMRKSYICNEMENMPDHNLLELFISGVIPRKDVKQISYDLFNTFGTLENIVNAPVEDLISVNGIGEAVAVQISLIKTLNKRIMRNKNKNVKSIKSVSDAAEFCKNKLAGETIEKVLLVIMDDSGIILGDYILGIGTVNESAFNARDAVRIAVNKNATNAIISHNHPKSNSNPSAADVDMTISLRKTFRDVGITLLEHIIVGNDGVSFVMKNGFVLEHNA